jgi:2-oxoglutarate dehydrogenase E2 component (dihydrolipoamide succinyltransferase)
MQVDAEIDGSMWSLQIRQHGHRRWHADRSGGSVINDGTDQMSFAGIEKAITPAGAKADGKLTIARCRAARSRFQRRRSYCVSSPILNPPQSGILGMHKIQDRPMAINGES